MIKINLSIIFISTLFSFTSTANTFECKNSVILSNPLVVEFYKDKLIISDLNSDTCLLRKDKEIINDPNYSGWIKLVPRIDEERDFCSNLENIFHRRQRKIFHLIVDKNIQTNKKGFTQIAYESYGREYGPKIIKSFLKCFPKE